MPKDTTRRTFLRNTLNTGMGLGVTLTIVNGQVQAQEKKKKLVPLQG